MGWLPTHSRYISISLANDKLPSHNIIVELKCILSIIMQWTILETAYITVIFSFKKVKVYVEFTGKVWSRLWL